MAVFTYVARDEAGQLVQGDVTATSPMEAAKIVRGDGKFVVRVAQRGSKAAAAKPKAASGAKSALAGGDKYRKTDLIFFTNQMAVMIETGVSMSDALEACEHDGNSPRFAKALEDVIRRVEGGSELSAALAEHPRVFPAIYISLIKASEASGTMAPILRRLSDHLQASFEMTKKIKGAVTYPIVMFVFAIGVTIFLLTWVLPKFTNIYAGREDKLPAATRILLNFSEHLKAYGPYLLGLLAAALAVFVWYYRTPAGRLVVANLKLRVPIIGALYHKSYLARSLRTLGAMLQSGVSMLDSVHLTASASGNPQYEKMWSDVNDRLETGAQLSEAMQEYKAVPKAVLKMLSAGEKSGRLGGVMERVAGFCEAELNATIKSVTALIEPAIVMVLGVVVGGLVLALLLPIFTISKAMR